MKLIHQTLINQQLVCLPIVSSISPVVYSPYIQSIILINKLIKLETFREKLEIVVEPNLSKYLYHSWGLI